MELPHPPKKLESGIKFIKYNENLVNRLLSAFNLTRHKTPNEKMHSTFNAKGWTLQTSFDSLAASRKMFCWLLSKPCCSFPTRASPPIMRTSYLILYILLFFYKRAKLLLKDEPAVKNEYCSFRELLVPSFRIGWLKSPSTPTSGRHSSFVLFSTCTDTQTHILKHNYKQ